MEAKRKLRVKVKMIFSKNGLSLIAVLCAVGLPMWVEGNADEQRDWVSFSPHVTATAWTVTGNVCRAPLVGLRIHNGWHKPIIFNRHFMYLSLEDSAGKGMPPGRLYAKADRFARGMVTEGWIAALPGKTIFVEWPISDAFSVHIGQPDPEEAAAMSNGVCRTIHIPSPGEYRLRLGYSSTQKTIRVANTIDGSVNEYKVWSGTTDLPVVHLQIRPGCRAELDPMEYGRASALLGGIGCYVVRSTERWRHLRTLLQRYAPARSIEQSFDTEPKFPEEILVAFFVACDSADRPEPSHARLENETWVVDFDVVKPDAPSFVTQWKLAGIVLPTSSSLRVSVPNPYVSALTDTSTPQRIEWRIEEGWGDVTDGLQAKLLVENTAIRSGEDIVVSLQLRCVPPEENAVYVWDNKYSKGYQNDSYHVSINGGEPRIYQRPPIERWDKNAPRPVAVRRDEPWHLGGWAYGEKIRKSLRLLGLNTSVPGKYSIVGFFAQEAETAVETHPDGARVQMWGGTISTAPVVVNVE